MSTTIRATFDGEVFRPDEPLSLPANTTVTITFEADASGPRLGEPYSALRYLESLNLEGPADWSQNFDEYLYHGKQFPDR